MNEYKDIMKNLIEMNRAIVAKKKVMMIIMAAALIALPTMAQDWQSTSAMQGSGSSYSPQVTAVGATSATSEATTSDTHSSANAPSGPRREIITPGNPGNQSGDSPVGDAVLPLLLMSFAFGMFVYLRRKRSAA
jgi:hypothetical protein